MTTEVASCPDHPEIAQGWVDDRWVCFGCVMDDPAEEDN